MEPVQQFPNGSQAPAQRTSSPRRDSDSYVSARPTDSYIEVGHLLTQFHRTSPVRAIAEAILDNAYDTDTSTLPLFNALASGSAHQWREQVVAAWALARVPLDSQERDAAAGMLLDTLERDEEESLWERFLRGLLWGYGTMLPLSLIWSVFLCRTDGSMEWADVFPQMLFVLGSLASVLTIPVCLLYGKLNNRNNDLLRAASAESLGLLHVVESIGPLAEGLFDSSPAVSESSAFALMQILPRLSEEDYGIMDHQAVARLAEALNHPNTLLVFKILEALKKVGTGQTLASVERLMREGKTRQLQETARQVAIVLEERRRREQESRHLMRATHAGPPAAGYASLADQAAGADELQTLNTGASAHQDWL